MPVTLSYPGVYVEELPSAVRTIMGVPTSVAAFVGTAPRGPVNEPQTLTSWGDYQRAFGGLDRNSPLSYAVYQYYANGGTLAEVVRIIGNNAAQSMLQLTDIKLQAKSAGTWGDKLRARVDYKTRDPSDTRLWNLTVRDTTIGLEERFLNIDADPTSPDSLDKVLRSSVLVIVDAPIPADTARPGESAPAQAGKDPFADGAGAAPPPPPPAGPAPAGPAPAGPAPAGPAPAGPAPAFVQASGGKDGDALDATAYLGDANKKTGIQALLKTDIFNMLIIAPPQPGADPPPGVLDAALGLSVDRRAMLIVDPPAAWSDLQTAVAGMAAPPVQGESAKNAALYFPRILVPDPLQKGAAVPFPPSGAVAGIWARTDAQRGVSKAPAGLDASVNGVQDLAVHLTDLENGELNPLGGNCLRSFPIVGSVVWGARTLRGADALADQWKYIPVRRTALFIEESLYRGTKWVVFEPNDEPLWSSIRLNVGNFMNTLFRQGAFQGTTPREAYLVKCDRENNPQADIDRGIVNILVGFAPLKPAEFVLIHIEQLAGQTGA